MPTLTMEQIGHYAKAAGFTGDQIAVAIAVAMAESSGRTDVVNFLGCTGLWQIYRAVHQPAHPHWTEAWLKQPANNAQAAYIISRGGKAWYFWETVSPKGPSARGNNGSYLKFLADARVAAAKVMASTAPPTRGSTPIATNGCTVQTVVNRASSQLGYRERGTNITKYWDDYAIAGFGGPGVGRGGSDWPWCAAFTGWLLWKSNWQYWMRFRTRYNVFHCSGWLQAGRDGAVMKTVSSPVPGAFAIWRGNQHISMVVEVANSGRFRDIGGNTSGSFSGSQFNGDGVYSKWYQRGSTMWPTSFVMPLGYDLVANPTMPINVSVPPTPDPNTPKGDYNTDGTIRSTGNFTYETVRVMARWIGLQWQVGDMTTFWKAWQTFCGLQGRYVTGRLDYVTIQVTQWRCQCPSINGVWDATAVRGVQSYLAKMQKAGFIT